MENKNYDDFNLKVDMDDSFSLESILAEYKGAAYISNDKRTPQDVLNAKVEKILSEDMDFSVASFENDDENAKDILPSKVPESVIQEPALNEQTQVFKKFSSDKSARSQVVNEQETAPAGVNILQTEEEDFLSDVREIVTEVERSNIKSAENSKKKRQFVLGRRQEKLKNNTDNEVSLFNQDAQSVHKDYQDKSSNVYTFPSTVIRDEHVEIEKSPDNEIFTKTDKNQSQKKIEIIHDNAEDLFAAVRF